MFEVRGRRNPDRIGHLLGSVSEAGELLSEEEALTIAAAVTCLDDACEAPLQLVRGTAARRAHFRHAPGSGSGCTAGSPETEWHTYIKLGVFGGAFAHEHTIPGARIDAVVKRIGTGKLVGIEVQHSPISRELVLQRHERHRAAGIAGTIWIVDAKHLDGSGLVKTRWVMDLLDACMATPASAQGTPGYGCTVGFFSDTLSEVFFADTINRVSDGLRPALRVIPTAPVPEAAVRVWAAGDREARAAAPHLAEAFTLLDACPTRRVKDFEKTQRAAARKESMKTRAVLSRAA